MYYNALFCDQKGRDQEMKKILITDNEYDALNMALLVAIAQATICGSNKKWAAYKKEWIKLAHKFNDLNRLKK